MHGKGNSEVRFFREAVTTVSHITGQPKYVVKAVIRAFLDYVVQALFNKATLYIYGFGTFKLKEIKKKVYWSPATGESVYKGDRYHPSFKFSRTIIKEINAMPIEGSPTIEEKPSDVEMPY